MSTNNRIRGRRLQMMRMHAFVRDPRCAKCGEAFMSPAELERDHKVPVHKGGNDTADNAQMLCKRCHAEKTALDMGYKLRLRVGPDGYPIA